MCEYCSKSEISLEKLDTKDSFTCEWISEEFGPGACSEQAEYAVSDWFVDEHLCEAHKRETEKLMGEGLGDFMDSIGFSSKYEIKRIQQEESCDHTNPTSSSWEPCGKRARYAKYILDTSMLCAEHAAEARREAENG